MKQYLPFLHCLSLSMRILALLLRRFGPVALVRLLIICIHSWLNFLSVQSRRVLNITSSMSDLGGMNVNLLGTLTLAWIIVYLIIYKGLHSSGKVEHSRDKDAGLLHYIIIFIFVIIVIIIIVIFIMIITIIIIIIVFFFYF